MHTCSAVKCTTFCGICKEKELCLRGPPVWSLNAHTKSSDRTTGIHPKFSTSYIRLLLGDSPIGMGQNFATLNPCSRSAWLLRTGGTTQTRRVLFCIRNFITSTKKSHSFPVCLIKPIQFLKAPGSGCLYSSQSEIQHRKPMRISKQFTSRNGESDKRDRPRKKTAQDHD